MYFYNPENNHYETGPNQCTYITYWYLPVQSEFFSFYLSDYGINYFPKHL